MPAPRSGDDPTPASAPSPAPSSGRPLRRRVRGATLRTAGQGDERAAVVPERPRIVDADAVRDELDAFEAAVERAHRESGAVPVPAPDSPTHHENDPPEGAEQ